MSGNMAKSVTIAWAISDARCMSLEMPIGVRGCWCMVISYICRRKGGMRGIVGWFVIYVLVKEG